MSGTRMRSVGMMCASEMLGLATPVRLSAFFSKVSCWSTWVRAFTSACSLVAISDSARTISIGARVPISTCFLLSSYSLWDSASACSFTFTFSPKLTRSQYAATICATVAITCCLNARSVTFWLFRAIRMFRLFTAIPKPCSRRWVTVKFMLATVFGLRSLYRLLEETVLVLQPSDTDVPVTNPWLIAETRAPAVHRHAAGAGSHRVGLRAGLVERVVVQ